MDLDELPVGQHKKTEFPPEFSSESPASTPHFPLNERLKSKNSKMRFEVSCELLKEISEATEFNKYYSIVGKLLGVSHPGAQEKEIECLQILLDKNPPTLSDDDFVSSIVEKCVSSSKISIKTKATDCLLILAELPGSQTIINDTLKNYFAGKTSPKVISAALYSLTQLLPNFGNAVFPVKDVIKQVIVQAGSTNTPIKSEAMKYIIEAQRWIKDKIMTSIETLKPAQQEELKKALQKTLIKHTKTSYKGTNDQGGR